MRTEVLTLTPAAADELLHVNTLNRPINRRRVEQFAHIITTGQWKLTHQGIAVGPTGTLEDGQHRLMGIARAGIPVPIMVTHLDETVFDVIDTGLARSSRDALMLAGIPYGQRLPAPIRLVTHYRSPSRDVPMGGHTSARLTNVEFIQIARDNPEFVTWAPVADQVSHLLGRRGLASSLLAAMVVIDQDVPGMLDSKATFWDRLGEPIGLYKGSPVLALRRWLVVTHPELPMQARSLMGMYGVIRAWNAYVEGREIGKIQVRLARDGAPDVSVGPV